jgi:hypothetical protein
VVFSLVVLLAAAGFAGGLVVALKRPRWLRVLVPVSAAAVVFRAVLVYGRPLDVLLFPFDLYPFVESWWAVPFGAHIFGAATARVRTFLLRDALWIIEGLALLYFGMLAWGESFTNLERLHGTVDDRGNCVQTSHYSCGAAAATSFLWSHGIETTEREMAYLGNTSQFYGTTLSGMVRALSRRLPGGRRSIRAARAGVDELHYPALCIIRTEIVNHWVVVDGITPLGVFLRNPAGKQHMNLDEFLRVWTGLAVWAQR